MGLAPQSGSLNSSWDRFGKLAKCHTCSHAIVGNTDSISMANAWHSEGKQLNRGSTCAIQYNRSNMVKDAYCHKPCVLHKPRYTSRIAMIQWRSRH